MPSSDLLKPGAQTDGTQPLRQTHTARSLADLYDSYSDFVYRSLEGLGVPPSLVEDAMQEVFIVANRHLSAFEGTFYKAWLFRLAHSLARNIRRSLRRVETPIEPLQLVDHRPSPFERAAYAEERRLLIELLGHLSETQREVFILAELEEVAHVEIAAALGVHVNTVANRLHAARATLEPLLRTYQQRIGSENNK